MSRLNIVRWILPCISVALTSNLIACGNDRVVQPPYQSSTYPQSQPQTRTNYSQQERELTNRLASHQQLCAEYTEKVNRSFQNGQDPGAVLLGGQSLNCQAASALESQLMQLQLQRQAGQ
jgi:hypothetical protein